MIKKIDFDGQIINLSINLTNEEALEIIEKSKKVDGDRQSTYIIMAIIQKQLEKIKEK